MFSRTSSDAEMPLEVPLASALISALMSWTRCGSIADCVCDLAGRKSESNWPIDRAVVDALAIAGGAKAQTEEKYKIARSAKSSDAERIAMVQLYGGWKEERQLRPNELPTYMCAYALEIRRMRKYEGTYMRGNEADEAS